MSARAHHADDAFLAEATAMDSRFGDAAAAIALALDPETPPPALRDAVVRAATPIGRLARFVGKLAGMLDVTREHAADLLDRLTELPWTSAHLPLPGSATCWVAGGPATAGAIRGFVRYPADAEFPPHTHLGDETVLFISGGATLSDGTELRPGDLCTMPAGSRHSLRTHPGPDLVYFVVVFDGVDMGDGLVLRAVD